MARRARSRISPSEPPRMASRMRSRSSSRSRRSPASPPPKRSSRRPLSTASRSTARKKNRSNRALNTWRSSWDLARVAAIASRKSPREVQLTASRASMASRSSEVPTAIPSSLRASANSSRREAMPGGPGASGIPPYRPPLAGLSPCSEEPIRELHPHPLCHQVEIGAVLDDDAHRLLEHRGVHVVGPQEHESPCPVDRLGDRGRLLQVEGADHVHHLHQLAGHALVQVGGVQPDYRKLALHVRIVEPEV